MKKIIITTILLSALFLFGNEQGNSVNAICCGAQGGTKVFVSNKNKLYASQVVISSNNTGGNVANGNIGGGSITTGTASSSSTQTISGNSNTTTIAITGTGATNTTNVVNTGNNVTVCTSASN